MFLDFHSCTGATSTIVAGAAAGAAAAKKAIVTFFPASFQPLEEPHAAFKFHFMFIFHRASALSDRALLQRRLPTDNIHCAA